MFGPVQNIHTCLLNVDVDLDPPCIPSDSPYEASDCDSPDADIDAQQKVTKILRKRISKRIHCNDLLSDSNLTECEEDSADYDVEEDIEIWVFARLGLWK